MELKVKNMNELEISSEFIEENKKNLCQSMPKSNLRKKSGPYSKKHKEVRRNEVYRLHFDYGYSARRIADMMKINRNTVNGDIDYWNSKIVGSNIIFSPEDAIIITIHRLEIQRTRLREQLDKTDSSQEKNAINRLIFDINCKIMQTNHTLAESTIRIMDSATRRLNEWLKDDRSKTRFLTLFDRIRVSDKAHEEITRIISEDQKKGDYY